MQSEQGGFVHSPPQLCRPDSLHYNTLQQPAPLSNANLLLSGPPRSSSGKRPFGRPQSWRQRPCTFLKGPSQFTRDDIRKWGTGFILNHNLLESHHSAKSDNRIELSTMPCMNRLGKRKPAGCLLSPAKSNWACSQVAFLLLAHYRACSLACFHRAAPRFHLV